MDFMDKRMAAYESAAIPDPRDLQEILEGKFLRQWTTKYDRDLRNNWQYFNNVKSYNLSSFCNICSIIDY